jgi:hypothetical protein
MNMKIQYYNKIRWVLAPNDAPPLHSTHINLSPTEDDVFEDPLKTVKLLFHDLCYKPAMFRTSEKGGGG